MGNVEYYYNFVPDQWKYIYETTTNTGTAASQQEISAYEIMKRQYDKAAQSQSLQYRMATEAVTENKMEKAKRRNLLLLCELK